jgi:hypothetical protein
MSHTLNSSPDPEEPECEECGGHGYLFIPYDFIKGQPIDDVQIKCICQKEEEDLRLVEMDNEFD